MQDSHNLPQIRTSEQAFISSKETGKLDSFILGLDILPKIGLRFLGKIYGAFCISISRNNNYNQQIRVCKYI